MGYKLADIVATLLLNIIHFTNSKDILSCNVSALRPCPGDDEVCNAVTGLCECLPGWKRVDGACVDDAGDVPVADNTTTTVVVLIFTIALIIAALILIVKKFRLVDVVREKLAQRRSNNVMYEDVMIGQDDPPINP